MSVGAESTDGESVTEELNRVLSGEALAKSPQLQAMLAYVVKETLAGRGSQIKAFNIAVDVFGRDESFDPATDSIVRVQAGRLRDALARHYETTAGASDIRIELPKGTYEPVFVRSETGGVPARAEPSPPGGVDTASIANDAARARDAKVSAPSMDGSVAGEGTGPRRSRGRFLSLCSAAILAVAVATLGYVFFAGSFGGREEVAREAGPTAKAAINSLLLASLTSLSETTEDQKFAEALTAELATSLARTGLLDLKLVAVGPVVAGEELRKLARSQNTYWAVSGVLQSAGKSQRANVYLMNVEDGGVIWSQDYNFDTDRRAPGALADAIMLDLRPQLYSAAKRRLEAKRDPTPLELFVLATWSPGVETNSLEWQLERIALARRAIAADSRYGPAQSVLADKLSLLANLDPAFDTEEAWREAAAAARQAGVLSPHSSEVAFNLVLYHFHLGDHDEALKLVRRTLDLDPGHTLARIWISALPYYCEPAPQAVVDELAAFDAGLAPSNPARWQAKTWLARLNLNNGNYRAAVEAARDSMQIVPNLGAALILAVAQVQLGEIEDARRVMADQRSYWKGFSFDHNNSVVLPRHCKSSSILDRLQAIYREAAAAMR